MKTTRWIVFLTVTLLSCPAAAQESQFASDWRRERERIKADCGEFSAKLASCALAIATDYPFHVAFGSLAPQNGFAFGLAFVEHYTPNERWRLGWNADGVAAPSGSWRAGAYMKIIRTPDQPGIVVRPGGSSAGSNAVTIREYPVLNLYGQTISLKQLWFFGLGSASTEAGKSVFSERETLVGSNLIWPIPASGPLGGLRPSFVGGLNARFIRIRGNASESAPPIDEVYDDNRAPGLNNQPAFIQFEEGIRFKPSAANGRLRLNYLVNFQQFLADADSHSSFRRWTIDLKHEIPLYRTVTSSGPRDTNGPDDCFVAVGTNSCPAISYSRNREGSVGLRLLMTSSSPFADSEVPFYLQPTLGGSDLNGQRLLASFEDYRFRGPQLVALQESVEHSLWGPLGVYALAEQGKVAEERGELDFRHLTHSYAVGLTVRAAGFPVMNFSFGWGPERRRVIATMDSSLLGGSSRPSLF